jgi:hypothetical protein
MEGYKMENLMREYGRLLGALRKLIEIKNLNQKIHMEIDREAQIVIFSTTVLQTPKELPLSITEFIDDKIPAVFPPFRSALIVESGKVLFVQKIPFHSIGQFRKTYSEFLSQAERWKENLLSKMNQDLLFSRK